RRAQAAIPNGLAVRIAYSNARAQGEMRLGDAWRVKPSDALLADLRAAFGGSVVEIVY
ncbi:hypothetical protein ACRTBZ_19480, partial [Burkholderia pseudomallei]